MYFCIKYLRYDNGVLFNLKVVGCFGKGGGGYSDFGFWNGINYLFCVIYMVLNLNNI